MAKTPISRRSWQSLLQDTLNRLPRAKSDGETEVTAPRVAVVGVGHEFRGDDFAGPAAARALQQRAVPDKALLILDAGAAPESFTGPLRRFAPDLILILDAADMGSEPGEIGWIDPDEVADAGGPTHALPLPLFAGFLGKSLGCPVRIIGIQPAADDFDTPLSGPVEAAVGALAADLVHLLQGHADK
jgi:hydrogenase 3 maturation protease